MVKAIVLVVEDEALIRMNAVEIVEAGGYDVLEAENADEAIRILESRNDISAVFTDINMSGSMDGLKLARAIRGRWPPIQLIITSGMNVPTPDELPENGRFIAKPYRAEHVVGALHDLIGA